MGISHCSIIGAHPDVKEVHICDTSKFLISAFKKHSNFICHKDYESMISQNKFDIIIISTPTKFHYSMVKLALKNNCHVFCEKPFILNVEDGIKLAKYADEKKIVNQVGFHNRFIGTFKLMKKLIDKNILGTLFNIKGEAYGPVVIKKDNKNWRSKPEEGGGCLYDYASHVINLMQFMVGTPNKVSGTFLKKIYSNQVEDAVYSSFTYDHVLSGQISVNWSEETYRKMSTKIEIFGEKGKIIADSQECQVFLKEDSDIHDLNKGWNSFWLTDQTNPVFFNLRGEEYSEQIDYFIQCIKNGNHSKNINSFFESVKTDRVIEMLREDHRLTNE